MTDIVKDLKECAKAVDKDRGFKTCLTDTMREAADEITRLRARVAELEGALTFYAGEHRYPNDGPWGVDSKDFGIVARQALKGGA